MRWSPITPAPMGASEAWGRRRHDPASYERVPSRIRDNGSHACASADGRLQLRRGALRGDGRAARRELLPLPSLPASIRGRGIAERPRCGRVVPRRLRGRRPEVLEARGRGREVVLRSLRLVHLRAQRQASGVDRRAHGHVRRRPGVRPSVRSWVGSAAEWEPIPDDGLPRHVGSRYGVARAHVSSVPSAVPRAHPPRPVRAAVSRGPGGRSPRSRSSRRPASPWWGARPSPARPRAGRARSRAG